MMMEVVVTTGAAGRAKHQSNRHVNKPTSSFLQYRPDALHIAQPTVSKNWREKYHTQALSTLSWPLAKPLVNPLTPVPKHKTTKTKS